MHNTLALVCLLSVVSLIFGQQYNSRFDNINIDDILNNKRVLGNYIKCILDEGPCTAEGREFREHVPEAIATNCAKCTNAQKSIIRKTSRYIVQNRAQDWERISNKFDPKREHKVSFQKFLDGN